MSKNRTVDNKMVYSPNNHIPIGEAVLLPDGSNGLQVKNPRTNKLDTISLDNLSQAVHLINARNNAETRTAQGLASQ